MIRFYYHPTPNPAKVALFLEEGGLPYEVLPVDTSKGEQHLPAFRKINPNGKVPAIVDTEGPGGQGSTGFRFERDPSLSSRQDREIPRLAGRPAGITLLVVLHRIRTWSFFGSGSALSVRRA